MVMNGTRTYWKGDRKEKVTGHAYSRGKKKTEVSSSRKIAYIDSLANIQIAKDLVHY
jgi:hypothetical protein